MPTVMVSGNFAAIILPLTRLSGARVELERGLSAGGDKARTKVRKALRDQTNVKRYSSIVSRSPSHRSGLTYTIEGQGKGLPIAEFPVQATAAGVEAEPWGVAHLFKRSFAMAKGFRARLTSRRFPIRALYGPSIAKEIGKDKSLNAFESAVRTDVMPAVMARLEALV